MHVLLLKFTYCFLGGLELVRQKEIILSATISLPSSFMNHAISYRINCMVIKQVFLATSSVLWSSLSLLGGWCGVVAFSPVRLC